MQERGAKYRARHSCHSSQEGHGLYLECAGRIQTLRRLAFCASMSIPCPYAALTQSPAYIIHRYHCTEPADGDGLLLCCEIYLPESPESGVEKPYLHSCWAVNLSRYPFQRDLQELLAYY